jgi:hypothetical protein
MSALSEPAAGTGKRQPNQSFPLLVLIAIVDRLFATSAATNDWPAALGTGTVSTTYG